jgi:hypothetical protein
MSIDGSKSNKTEEEVENTACGISSEREIKM